jgi:hypothetical protein
MPLFDDGPFLAEIKYTCRCARGRDHSGTAAPSSRVVAYNTRQGMSLGLTLSIVSTVLIVLAMISMWISFAVLPDNFSCTDKDFNTACFPGCVSGKLPGEAEYLASRSHAYTYELQPWYLGDRTCAWFDKDPARCRLPHRGDICFDLVTWNDTTGRNCEAWTKYIHTRQNKTTNTSYSDRELGDDALCHSAPPHNPNMSSAELQEMRRACCVCGAHRDERNYQGSLSTRHPGSFPTVLPPPQHRGKIVTHLTQCCGCDSRGKMPTQDGKEDNIRKRGGTWICKKTKYGHQRFFTMGEPNVTRQNIGISAITLSFASVISLGLLMRAFYSSTPKNDTDDSSGSTSTRHWGLRPHADDDVDVPLASRFLLRL